MTIIDLLTTPALVEQAWGYFRDVQTKDTKYVPFITAETPPPIWLNKEVLERFRPELRKLYYDPTRFGTYLEQLGVTYPTLRRPQ